jgi:glucose-1-phosphate adenylyltransferase
MPEEFGVYRKGKLLMWKKECVAMILAGGQGSRLGILTKGNAKPGVPFGGKFRIIDFVLSNCKRSNIDTVGVLTQYKPLVLNKYLANGSPWDLDSYHGGLYILPPYVTEDGGNWYEGTADAIFQNLDYLEQYNPEYVLVLSGDHIYNMDYRDMLEEHKKSVGDLTIAVLEVPWDEASRFGVMKTDEKGKITGFEEKAKNPSSNLASMGIYIFNYEILKEFLTEDHQDKDSEHDFGKNIIPKMLEANRNLFAYRFNGYWRDVGTLESYYQANMDLLESIPSLNDVLFGEQRVYSNYKFLPPHYIGERAKIKKSIAADGSTILGEISNSIVFAGSFVGEKVKLEGCILLPNAHLEGEKTYKNVIITEDNIVIKISKGDEDDQ